MLVVKARLVFGENTGVSEPCIYRERLTRWGKKKEKRKKNRTTVSAIVPMNSSLETDIPYR